jgi:hypothetical protein
LSLELADGSYCRPDTRLKKEDPWSLWHIAKSEKPVPDVDHRHCCWTPSNTA